jgi:hypothetical protein
MDQFLAEYYGTGGGVAEATDDDMSKQAQVELFAKMAAAEGIDLEQLTDEQVETLYNSTFSKEASGDGDADDKGDEDEKKEKAKEEHEEKKAQQEKLGEADFLGRVMAHAYVQELNKIASATEESDKEAGVADWAKGVAGAVKSHAQGLAAHATGKGTHVGLARATHDAKKGVRRAGQLLSGSRAKRLEAGAEKLERTAKKSRGFDKIEDTAAALKRRGMTNEEKSKVLKARLGAGGATAALAAGGGYAATREKKASAIDELAAIEAVTKAAEAGWDDAQAAELVGDLLDAGVSDEGSKVAMAADVDGAIDIRASELLEMAGYPVSWD